MYKNYKDIFMADGMFATTEESKKDTVKRLNDLIKLGKAKRVRLLLAEIENDKYQIEFYTRYIDGIYAAIETILGEEEECIR